MNKFIHRSFVVYLSLIMLVRMMAMPLSLLDYAVNRSFIASNLCENRLKTTLHCAGKCYLTKQLAKANDQQDSQGQKGGIKNLIIDFFEPLNKPSFGCPLVLSENHGQTQARRLNDRFTADIFHPPIA